MCSNLLPEIGVKISKLLQNVDNKFSTESNFGKEPKKKKTCPLRQKIQKPQSKANQVLTNMVHSKKKSSSKHLFSVLRLVANRGLYSVSGRTKWYLEAP